MSKGLGEGKLGLQTHGNCDIINTFNFKLLHVVICYTATNNYNETY